MAEYKEIIGKDNSVKTFSVIQNPTKDSPGIADVMYRNVYSVYDVGTMRMPQDSKVDNSTILAMAAKNFEDLEKLGVKTHYLGVIGNNGKETSVSTLLDKGELPTAMRVLFVNKIKPVYDKGYNYNIFKSPTSNNYVVPLEVIFRNELPPESSVWGRIERGETTLTELGLSEDLKPGDVLPQAVIDISSKYESKDRYVLKEEGRDMAGLSYDLWYPMIEAAEKINLFLTEKAESLGFTHPDGKVEFVRNGLDILLADVAGTWHEDRFSYNAQKISKQLMRDAHAIQDPEWAAQCKSAKTEAEKRQIEDWQSLLITDYTPLEPEFFEAYNNLTRAATNKWLGAKVFASTSLDDAIIQFKQYWDDFKSRKGAA